MHSQRLSGSTTPATTPLTCGTWKLGARLLHLDGVARQFADVVLVDTQQDVLRLDVSVDDATLLV